MLLDLRSLWEAPPGAVLFALAGQLTTAVLAPSHNSGALTQSRQGNDIRPSRTTADVEGLA